MSRQFIGPEEGDAVLRLSECMHPGQRCWACMTGGCYETPIAHIWWDSDDVEAAEKNGFPPPHGLCACAFCGTPALAKMKARNDG